MNTLSGDTYPQLCFEVGLTCEGCVSNTARQLATTCRGLRGKMLGQMFVQLYPNQACSPMHRDFSEAYLYAEAVVVTKEESVKEAQDAQRQRFARTGVATAAGPGTSTGTGSDRYAGGTRVVLDGLSSSSSIHGTAPLLSSTSTRETTAAIRRVRAAVA
jgi:hypothetical protein